MARMSTLIMSCFTHRTLTRFSLKARHIKGMHIFPRRGNRSFGCNTKILWNKAHLLYVFTHMAMLTWTGVYLLLYTLRVHAKMILKTICLWIWMCGCMDVHTPTINAQYVCECLPLSVKHVYKYFVCVCVFAWVCDKCVPSVSRCCVECRLRGQPDSWQAFWQACAPYW